MTYGSMAYLPDREWQSASASVRNQLDEFKAFCGNNDLGDANKFLGVVGKEGYLFTFDDDLIYPEGYVTDMIQAIERYGRKAVVTLHGKLIHRQPIKSFYGRDFIKFRCLDEVKKNAKVHIPGTGVMAWHSDTIQFEMSDFPEKNMADIWAGIKCQKENVPIVCLSHDKGYIKPIPNDEGCYKWNRDRDNILTEAINSIEWK